AISNEEIKVIPFNPGERALRRLRRKGRDFRGLSGGSLLLTLRGMFFSYFSDTRELNTVAGKAIPAKNVSDASVRGRSGPGKAIAAAGAYLRVSGPEGR
ncbi:hypothetical protein, partial [Klebsiella quasipneumoniae]